MVGFDDDPLAAAGLTSVRQDVDAKGRAAAQALFEAMDFARARPTHTLLPTELVVRETSAPPPS